MDLSDSPDDATFRKTVRAWLKKNVPAWRKDRSGDSLEYDDPKRITRAKEWQRKLHAAGYVAMGWPKEFGGQRADHHRHDGHQHGRPDADDARHRRAEARVPAEDPPRRRALVPGLLGAGL